jgi:hypothetical protein
MSSRAIRVLLVACLVLGAGCAGLEPAAPSATPTPSAPADGGAQSPTTTGPVSTPGSDYDTATVVLLDTNGTELATVEAWVADTWPKQYTGLSDTDALDDGQGMLFVFDGESDRAFVMRDMAFPLDMVFVAADGTITTIHHAPVESDGDLTQYTGRAKYVLEVPMGYTNETGVEVGDRMRIEER